MSMITNTPGGAVCNRSAAERDSLLLQYIFSRDGVATLFIQKAHIHTKLVCSARQGCGDTNPKTVCHQ